MHIILHGTFDVVTFWSWYPDPVVIFGVIITGWLYLRSIGRRREETGDLKPVDTWRMISFFAGLAAIVVALLSPLEQLADDYLLSAHMVQHILLMIALPVLILLGMPAWMFEPFKRVGWFWKSWCFATRPLLAFALFHVPFTLSHLPVFYDLALRNDLVHIFEHIVYIGGSFLVWWVILAPDRDMGRLAPALAMIFLFVETIPGQIVGAMITYAEEPLYSTYEHAPRVWGLSPLTDQQIGGLIMWIVTSSIYLTALAIVFFRWASSEERVLTSPSTGTETRRTIGTIQ